MLQLSCLCGDVDGWFLQADGWDRTLRRRTARVIVQLDIRAVASSFLWHYHAEAWSFAYRILMRTTCMRRTSGDGSGKARLTLVLAHYESPDGACGASKCSQEVLALGNPLIWWRAATAALFHQAWRWDRLPRPAVRRRTVRVPGWLVSFGL